MPQEISRTMCMIDGEQYEVVTTINKVVAPKQAMPKLIKPASKSISVPKKSESVSLKPAATKLPTLIVAGAKNKRLKV